MRYTFSVFKATLYLRYQSEDGREGYGIQEDKTFSTREAAVKWVNYTLNNIKLGKLSEEVKEKGFEEVTSARLHIITEVKVHTK